MPRILFVEDHEDLRDLVSSYLSAELPVEVFSLESGNLAIEELRDGVVYDFIITDFIMNNGNGADLLQFMSDKKIETPTVLFTNTVNPRLKDKPENFIGIIEKLNLEQLKKMICNKLNLPD